MTAILIMNLQLDKKTNTTYFYTNICCTAASHTPQWNCIQLIIILIKTTNYTSLAFQDSCTAVPIFFNTSHTMIHTNKISRATSYFLCYGTQQGQQSFLKN